MAPRRRNVPTLTKDQIVEAALALIDERGADGFTLRALSASLGVDPSTIYYHVPNKLALEDLVVCRVMSLVPERPCSEADPVEFVVASGVSYIQAAMRHPQVVPLLAHRTVRTPATLAPVERVLEVLLGAGLEFRDAAIAMQAFSLFVSGAAQEYAAAVIAEARGGQHITGDEEIDEARYPRLARLMQMEDPPGYLESCETGLRALARGLLESR